MRTGTFAAIAVLLALGYATPALALQGLCSHSPENPTAILGLLAAGAASLPYVKRRARSWLGRKSRSGEEQ